MQNSSLVNLLQTRKVTAFIPSNEAFLAADLNFSDLNSIRSLLLNHLVLDSVTSTMDVQPRLFLRTVGGGLVLLERTPTGVTVNGIEITKPNNPAANGVFHIIDRVLSPIVQIAAAHIPRVICSGDAIYDCASTPCALQEKCANGCLAPMPGLAICLAICLPVAAESVVPIQEEPIFDKISSIPSLSTLLVILQDPRFAVAQEWINHNPVTLFAPTNEAFAKAHLNFSDVQRVQSLLRYLIAPNQTIIMSRLTDNQTVPTLQGGNLAGQ